MSVYANNPYSPLIKEARRLADTAERFDRDRSTERHNAHLSWLSEVNAVNFERVQLRTLHRRGEAEDYVQCEERLDARLEAAKRRLKERDREIDDRTEAAREAQSVYGRIRRARDDFYDRTSDLTPWEFEAALQAEVRSTRYKSLQQLLPNAEMLEPLEDREASVGDGPEGLMKMKEVVALFETELGVGRSQFYARFRPMLTTVYLARDRVVMGGREMMQYRGLRVRRRDAESLIQYVSNKPQFVFPGRVVK